MIEECDVNVVARQRILSGIGIHCDNEFDSQVECFFQIAAKDSASSVSPSIASVTSF